MSIAGLSSPEAEAFVKAVGAAADLPSFVRNVQSIGSLGADLDARVELLERAITQDIALSAKILRIANSTTGGGGERTVGSVKQAIMMLGFDRVQHLSAAASVFDEVDKKAPAVRDLQIQSVLAANLGLQLASAAGYDKPELAYLCGMFRRFGEMLVACYRPTPYREWTEQVTSDGPFAEGAEAKQFGFTFEEVGVALAKRWGLPDAVVRTMRTFRGVSQDLQVLHAITQCSVELVSALDGDPAAGGTAGEIRARFAPLIGVDASTMDTCIEGMLEEAAPTLRGMQVNLDTWRKARAEATAVTRKKRNAEGPRAGRVAGEKQRTPADEAVAPRAADRLAPSATDTAQESRLRAVVRDLAKQRDQGSAPGSFSVSSVTDSTLRAACEAGYERGVLGINSEDLTMIRGRVGIGRGNAELARNFLVRTTAAFGPLAAALQTHTDLFIEMTGADAKTYKRDRIIKDLDPSAFALLPMVIDSKLIGCLYFDSTIESVPDSETSRQLLRDLRDSLVAAFARHRSSATESATGSA